MPQKVRGRSSQYNPKNRFESISVDYSVFEDDSLYYDSPDERKIETIFYKDDSKSVISKNDSEDLYFDYSFNPYRGCEHGCIYCYARPTHEFLGFSSGLDFETKIMVKEDAPKLLEETFNKKNYVPKMLMFSGNTDCYQPVEKKLQITRKALQVCLDYKNPVAIITKNALIRRDIDILSELAKMNLINVMISITSLNKELCSKMEPRTSAPTKKLEAIAELAKNNIPVGVNVAPIIPGLTDEETPAILKAASENGATFASWIMLRLPYSVKDLFLEWLQNEFPDRASKVINKIKDVRGGKLNDSEFGKRFVGEGEIKDAIENLFKISCKKYGINKRIYELSTTQFQNKNNSQLNLF